MSGEPASREEGPYGKRTCVVCRMRAANSRGCRCRTCFVEWDRREKAAELAADEAMAGMTMLDRMRKVFKQDETLDRGNAERVLRKLLKKDVKGFMGQMLSLEKAELAGRGKESVAAEVGPVGAGEDPVSVKLQVSIGEHLGDVLREVAARRVEFS